MGRIKTTAMAVMILVTAAMGQEALSATVSVMHGWPSQQGDAFQKIVSAFEVDNKDIRIQVEIVGRDRPAILATRLAAGNPPDLTPHPWLGMQADWARQGLIQPLDGLMDPGELLEALKPLGYVDGKLFGLLVFPNIKSLIWYNKKAFAAKGYQVPDTWSDMMELSQTIAADGAAPWAIGLESGAASGWPGTDWIEDIILHKAGPDLYDQWVRHEIPWTHPAVKEAFDIFGRIAGSEKYVLGGATGALTTNFGDAPSALFTDPPHAYLHHQATFIQGFIQTQNPALKAGEDFDVFPFPAFDRNGGGAGAVLVSGDVINLFSKRPEVIRFAKFLISRPAQEIWVRELDELSSNKNTDPALFTNPVTRKAWEMLSTARISRYDGSDLMPAAVGTGAFWSGILDYISGEALETVLENIEAAAQDAYGSK